MSTMDSSRKQPHSVLGGATYSDDLDGRWLHKVVHRSHAIQICSNSNKSSRHRQVELENSHMSQQGRKEGRALTLRVVYAEGVYECSVKGESPANGQ